MDTDLTFEDKREILNDLAGDDEEQSPILIDGFEGSLVGYTTLDDHLRAVYDYDKCLEYYMNQNGCSFEDALDWFEYNTMRSLDYLPPDKRPIIVHSF